LNADNEKKIALKEIYSDESIPGGFLDLLTEKNLDVTNGTLEITNAVNILLEKLR